MSGHEPIMTADVLAWLVPSRGGVFVDCTTGLGGHAAALMGAGATRLVAIDRDQASLALAEGALGTWRDKVELVHADYRGLSAVLDRLGLATVHGILADLGISSWQLAAEGRGFSFQRDDPLDMRMDQSRGRPLAALIADATESELADVIFQFGEERYARRIARRVAEASTAGRLATTRDLAQAVRRAIPRRGSARIDPATRTFQAFRIWTNGELEGLDRFLGDATARLARGGRLVVITFHSLEDRIVKHTFRALARAGGEVTILTKKPVTPGDEEIRRNPRSRSAKLRAVERRG